MILAEYVKLPWKRRLGFRNFLHYVEYHSILWTLHFLWKLRVRNNIHCQWTRHMGNYKSNQYLNHSTTTLVEWIVKDIQGEGKYWSFLRAGPISGVQLSDTGCDQLLPKNYFPCPFLLHNICQYKWLLGWLTQNKTLLMLKDYWPLLVAPPPHTSPEKNYLKIMFIHRAIADRSVPSVFNEM